jgi:hypothetical protein
VALIALVAIAVLAFAYALTSRLNAASMFVGVDRDHNSQVMARAKQALIGWMAINAAGTDPSPGRLPCPEAPGDFNTVNEGSGAGNCVLPAVGRLPWRQLGLEKLFDAAGEPLWYVVSPGWALASGFPPVKPTINSDSAGQLGLDGDPVVALIIAPGAALTTEACGGASARSQARPVAGPPDLRDYFECGNANSPVDTAFVGSAPGNTFNDQVLAVRVSDLMPALEAAVQQRMQREIAPALKSVYGSASWGTSTGNPLFPFAAPFGDPGTSNYRGADGIYQGLLPFTSASASCGADPRCAATFVDWSTSTSPTLTKLSGVGLILFPGCDFDAQYTRCWGEYVGGPADIRVRSRLNNAAMALRTLDNAGTYFYYWNIWTGAWVQWNGTATASFNSSGQAIVDAVGTLPGLPWQTWFYVYVDRRVLADHPLLDPNDPATGWFVRNEWYRLVYYAAAQESTADGLPSYGCDSSDCLRFNGVRNIRALLVLAGRSMSDSPVRPNGSLGDYVEYQNGDVGTAFEGIGTTYEQRPARMSRVSIPALNAPFNDRVVLVDWISPAPTFPLASLP